MESDDDDDSYFDRLQDHVDGIPDYPEDIDCLDDCDAADVFLDDEEYYAAIVERNATDSIFQPEEAQAWQIIRDIEVPRVFDTISEVKGLAIDSLIPFLHANLPLSATLLSIAEVARQSYQSAYKILADNLCEPSIVIGLVMSMDGLRIMNMWVLFNSNFTFSDSRILEALSNLVLGYYLETFNMSLSGSEAPSIGITVDEFVCIPFGEPLLQWPGGRLLSSELTEECHMYTSGGTFVAASTLESGYSFCNLSDEHIEHMVGMKSGKDSAAVTKWFSDRLRGGLGLGIVMDTRLVAWCLFTDDGDIGVLDTAAGFQWLDLEAKIICRINTLVDVGPTRFLRANIASSNTYLQNVFSSLGFSKQANVFRSSTLLL